VADFFKTIAADAGAAQKGKKRTTARKVGKVSIDTLAASKSKDTIKPSKDGLKQSVPAQTTRRGRPKGSGKQGKRSAQGYTLHGAYITDKTFDDVIDALREDNRKLKRGEKKKDYSEAVEEALIEWLNRRK
jgi:hypothetical protein